MIKFLFLDIDGCLNGHEKLASGYCGIRHDRAVVLNRILDAVPEVQLVISSAWRYLTFRGDMTIKGFEYLLLLHGVKCFERVHGVTAPDPAEMIPNDFDATAWTAIGLKWRAWQISKYLEDHGPSHYVVIDDLSLNVPNLVQTDGTIGLTEHDADRAIAILQGKAVQAA